MTKRLVLASASPRRRELLGLLGLPFDVLPGQFPEESVSTASLTPAEWVQQVAVGKARDIAAHIAEDAVIIGADTTVVLHGQYLNKPTDAADAARMLRLLSGQTHEVYTGLCLIDIAAGRLQTTQTDAARSRVTFDTLSDKTIAAYVATGEPLDKAGAYGIQGDALRFIPQIEGDYYNIVGLPLELLRSLLLPYFPNIALAPEQPKFPAADYGRAA
jgi:septum formation protein